MGFLSLLSGAFGGSDAANKSVDLISSSVKGIGNFIDEQDFTEEEKTKANLELNRLNQDLVKSTMHENSVRSVTRRLLAWSIMGSFLFLVIFSALIYGVPFPSDVEGISFGAQWANHVMEVLSELSNMALAVSVFYFGSALLGSKSKP